jgi:regulator of protease activity HflC (stomatin/prohibitin superfamily)
MVPSGGPIGEQQRGIELDTLAYDGLAVHLLGEVSFQPAPGESSQLIAYAGDKYFERLLMPYVRSSARRIVGRLTPAQLQSLGTEGLQRRILEDCRQALSGRHLRINAVAIQHLSLTASPRAGLCLA